MDDIFEVTDSPNESTFSVSETPDGFLFVCSKRDARAVSAKVGPAHAMALIMYLQEKLEMQVGAEKLLGPYEKCPKCKMWIHQHTKIAHTCQA